MAYLRGGLLVSSLFYISREEDVINFDFPMVLLCAYDRRRLKCGVSLASGVFSTPEMFLEALSS